MGGMRVPLLALLWILLKAQVLSVGALGEETPALQEMGHALVTLPGPRGGKMTRNEIKWEMKRSREEGWREGERKEGKTGRERTKKPFKKTAREGTPIPKTGAARVRTQGPLNKTAKLGPQNP